MIVFFDVDDTLVNHSSAERSAALLFYGQYAGDRAMAGLDGDTFCTRWHDAAERHFATFNAGDCSYQEQRRRRIREFFGADVTDQAADDLFGVYLASYEAHWALFPDVLPCLDALAGHKLGIVSNNSLTATQRKLRRVGIAERFGVVIAPETAGVSKPDHRIFEAACQQVSAPANQCVYVGDRLETDARAASAAGMIGVWIDRRGESASPRDGIVTIRDLRELARRLKG
ncbi:MAG: HAD family hydrolase [Chloroflexi bacterium]|nr:MAG: HAD family hydrolase [Chloroflexota bacterium]